MTPFQVNHFFITKYYLFNFGFKSLLLDPIELLIESMEPFLENKESGPIELLLESIEPLLESTELLLECLVVKFGLTFVDFIVLDLKAPMERIN